jgi:hypothetical protein
MLGLARPNDPEWAGRPGPRGDATGWRRFTALWRKPLGLNPYLAPGMWSPRGQHISTAYAQTALGQRAAPHFPRREGERRVEPLLPAFKAAPFTAVWWYATAALFGLARVGVWVGLRLDAWRERRRKWRQGLPPRCW